MSVIKPYWQSGDGSIKVFHAPCEDVIAAGLVPVDDVSLIHDDPPYGIGNNSLDRSGGKRPVGRFRKFAPMEGNEGPFDPAPILALKRPTVFWGANHYADKLPPSPAWLLWDKRCDTPPDDGSDGELAWCSPGGSWGGTVRIFRHLWRGLCRASEKNGRTGPGHAGAHLHPTQKPKALVSFVFQRAKLKRGDLVFVPHAGSLPEGPVCQAMGLRLIACEVERQYCDVAVSRLGAITQERAAEPCGPLFGAPVRK